MSERPALLGLGALFISAAILFLGGGLNGVLIPVRAALESYSTLQIGLLGTAAAVGTIIGCILTPGLIAQVGHIRAFAVLAAGAAVVALLHGLVVDPWFWVALRIPTGLCFAGLATVIESWLNASAGNRARGRVMATYMIIQLSMQTAGQLLLMSADPATLTLFAVVALAITASLIPVGLTRAITPGPVANVRLRLGRLYHASPSGVAGALAVGLVNGAFWALAPLYASDQGLATAEIALFMSAAVIGGALLQYPLGRLSDRIDRRHVILGTATATGLAALALALLAGRFAAGPLWFAGMLGGFMFALYPLSVAHVNDHVAEGRFVEASSGLLLLQGTGAVAGPILGALVMGIVGSVGLFFYIAVINLLLLAFVSSRLQRAPRPTAAEREDFVVLPSSATAGLDLDPRAAELDEVSEEEQWP
ncbi:MAG: MFS transporter [Wenzhouxiangella sp.]|nr:MAG: MFS transporter [Wenzhouxiangella sp.]